MICSLLDLVEPVSPLDAAIAPAITAPESRPRERLWLHGPARLTDTELVAIVLGTGVRGRPALAVASALVSSVGGLGWLARAVPAELATAHGVGNAQAARLAAGFELGRRVLEAPGRTVLGTAADVWHLLRPKLTGLPQEIFVVIGIDARNAVLGDVEVARGQLSSVEVHPREVFRPLIRMAAAGAVVAHNHPSGDPTPSVEDVGLTRRLRAVGELVGIPVIDHVVIGREGYCSIAEWLGTEY